MRSPIIETAALNFDHLISQLRLHFAILPDTRKGKNTTYRVQDAAAAAFSVFFSQTPSFLAYQRQMQQKNGHNNAQSLFQITNIPSDNQIRNLLDPISPERLSPLFEEVFSALYSANYLESYRHINNTLLIPLDGVCYYSTNSSVHCDKCSQQHHKNGEITYTHTAITPVIVAPGHPQVISLPPEFITPQDGHEKQDCERAAAKRWLDKYAEKLSALGVTFLGDDLYSCQPLCEAFLAKMCHFILTCKRDSHKTLYEWVDELANLNKITTVIRERRQGQKKWTETYSFLNLN